MQWVTCDSKQVSRLQENCSGRGTPSASLKVALISLRPATPPIRCGRVSGSPLRSRYRGNHEHHVYLPCLMTSNKPGRYSETEGLVCFPCSRQQPHPTHERNTALPTPHRDVVAQLLRVGRAHREQEATAAALVGASIGPPTTVGFTTKNASIGVMAPASNAAYENLMAPVIQRPQNPEDEGICRTHWNSQTDLQQVRCDTQQAAGGSQTAQGWAGYNWKVRHALLLVYKGLGLLGTLFVDHTCTDSPRWVASLAAK